MCDNTGCYIKGKIWIFYPLPRFSMHVGKKQIRLNLTLYNILVIIYSIYNNYKHKS